ncbi:hypothetical protein HK104_002514 [Borealophlyctis nickersoniae]|nr:hypothetical protein HK104_002514 [Borealophlyctis nickersoniae]
MGGHANEKYPPLLFDPAVEKHYHMWENSPQHVKWNRKIGYMAGLIVFGLPLMYYCIHKVNHNKFDIRAKARGETAYYWGGAWTNWPEQARIARLEWAERKKELIRQMEEYNRKEAELLARLDALDAERAAKGASA